MIVEQQEQENLASEAIGHLLNLEGDARRVYYRILPDDVRKKVRDIFLNFARSRKSGSLHSPNIPTPNDSEMPISGA